MDGELLPLEWLGRRFGLHPPGGGIYESPRRRAPRTGRRSAAAAPRAIAVNLTATLKEQIALVGADTVAAMCDVVEHDDLAKATLLDPPAPWRGLLRLLYAVDPNPGPDGRTQRVLLLVRADRAATCREAAAATFGIGRDFYAPVREV